MWALWIVPSVIYSIQQFCLNLFPHHHIHPVYTWAIKLSIIIVYSLSQSYFSVPVTSLLGWLVLSFLLMPRILPTGFNSMCWCSEVIRNWHIWLHFFFFFLSETHELFYSMCNVTNRKSSFQNIGFYNLCRTTIHLV